MLNHRQLCICSVGLRNNQQKCMELLPLPDPLAVARAWMPDFHCQLFAFAGYCRWAFLIPAAYA